MKMNEATELAAPPSRYDFQTSPLQAEQMVVGKMVRNDYPYLPEDVGNSLLDIEKASRRMQSVVQELMNYSINKSVNYRFKYTDVTQLIGGVKQELAAELSLKHAAIEVTGVCQIFIIPFQFQQLLHNLISNSLKYADPDRPLNITITYNVKHGDGNSLGLSPQNNYCQITVADNGIGFDPKSKDDIFKALERYHSVYKDYRLGVGLPIVKKIVENHRGYITATGVPGVGASFDIFIPLRRSKKRTLAIMNIPKAD